MSCSDPWEGIHDISNMGVSGVWRTVRCTCGMVMSAQSKTRLLKIIIEHYDVMKVRWILLGT